MSKGLKLIQKMARRAKYVKEKVRGFDQQAKTDKLDEVMKANPAVYHAMIHPQRKADGRSTKAGFGTDVTMKKPRLEYKLKATTVERFDYGGFSYGIRLTVPAGLIADSRVQAGDVVELLSGSLKGKYYKVVAVTDSTHLRLEDDTSDIGPAGLPEITSVTTVADVAGSLNSKYWLLARALDTTKYYIWYNINGAGVDPAVAGRTGIMVAAATAASAITIATATKSALDGISGAWTTGRVNAVLTITDQATGHATDAANGGASPGFTILVTQQGTDDDPTGTESNKYARIQLSSEKKSYK